MKSNFFKIQSLQNQKGMSLTELITAAAITTIVALFAGKIIADLIVTKNTAEFHGSKISLSNDINKFLSTDSLCRCSFSSAAPIIPNPPVAGVSYAINALDIFTDPSNCGSAIKNTIATTGNNYNDITVQSIQLNNIRRISNQQLIARLSLNLYNRRTILENRNSILEFNVPLQVAANAAGTNFTIQGCGKPPVQVPQVFQPAISRALFQGTRIYTFPGLSGRNLGLIEIRFDGGRNYRLDVLPLVGAGPALGTYSFKTGVSGHIRRGMVTAVIPLENGRFRADCDAGGGCGGSLTLVATFPAP